MGTKNNPGPFDCYANAEPDEPIFVLLGRDKHAPALVWLWAAMREIEDEDKVKVGEARDCVDAMCVYAAARGKPAVGLGQAALVGVMDLCRAANSAKDLLRALEGLPPPQNQATRDTIMRLILAQTHPEPEAPATP